MATALPTLPPIATYSTLADSQITDVLDLLFEPTPALHTLVLPSIKSDAAESFTFQSYADLIKRIKHILDEVAAIAQKEDTEGQQARLMLENVLASHPRLGEKKVESAMSRAEQAAMLAASAAAKSTDMATVGSPQTSAASKGSADAEAEAATLLKLNQEYEAAFPGLRYVVFVAGRPRPVIFENMRSRIARNDIVKERQEAIQAMCDIANDRVQKLGSV